MRLIVLSLLLSGLFIVAIPAHAANCDGLQVAGALSTGTYTMTDHCVITDTLTVAGGETVTINGGGFAINGGGSRRIFNVSTGGTLNLNNVTLTNGYAGTFSGGAIANSAGTVTITNSTFSGNTGDLGGAIYNFVGTMTITNSTFSGNDAGASGGAIANNNGTVAITNSTFSSNDAVLRGGAIANNGTVTITNSTFSDNTSSTIGGAIYNSGTVTITNSTLSGNTALANGGAIYNFVGTVTITNSIVSNNASPGGNCYVNAGAIIDNGGNIEDTDTCGFADFPNTNPMLGGFNGAYFPLLEGSPAIDSAPDCAGLTTDQSGTSRPQGSACDIGAIEMPQIIDPDTGAPVIMQPSMPAPPMCNTLREISAAGLPDGVYCRVLMQNGAWMTDAGTVPGNLALAHPTLAVDVFRITGQSVTSSDFGGYVQICLPGEGRLIFLDATQSPRPQVEITPVEFINDATCGWIPNAGTVVLIPQ